MNQLAAFADSLAEGYRSTHRIPGLAVGVVLGHDILLRAGYGITRQGGAIPVTSRTLFHMASITKPIVATAVMQLAERGQVELDAAYARYVPEFCIADHRGAAITVRQLLTHTSGLPDVENYDWERPEFDDGALQRYIASLGSIRLLSPPGERFAYSDIGFDILGALISRVAGGSFEDYVAGHILEPLGMCDSSLLVQGVDQGLLASPHVLNQWGHPVVSRVFPYNRRHAGSSTLYSNVDDMLRWSEANLGGGELAGRRILRADMHAAMWVPAIGNVHSSIPRNGSVGLSWFIFHRNGTRVVGHMGQDEGFATLMLLVPDRQLAIVSMANRSHDHAQFGLWDLQFRLIDRLCP
jgi:CubicO group peptidase (beta-lactamase class C family)